MTEKLMTKVHLIDSITRLGVIYHFEHEIEEVLQHIHKNYVENEEITIFEDNICSLAVLFRLLRQQGLHVSPSIPSTYLLGFLCILLFKSILLTINNIIKYISF